MEKLYHIIYEKDALNDIKRIKEHYSDRYYEKTISNIIKILDIIKIFPRISKTIYYKKDKFGDYRKAITGKYVIIYKVENKTIKVLKIFNVRENYLNNNMFMVKENISKYTCVS